MDLERRSRSHAALGDPHRLAMIDELSVSDRTFQELSEVAGLPGNLTAHHLAVLEDAGLIERRASEGDRRRRYISLRQDRLGALAIGRPIVPGLVLFLCTHNSARSQFAAGLWRQRTGQVAESAGTEPAPRVHPKAVQVAREYEVDLTDARPRSVRDLDREPEIVVSVCDRAYEAGQDITANAIHWSIPDPVTTNSVAAFRSAFASISSRVERLATAVHTVNRIEDHAHV